MITCTPDIFSRYISVMDFKKIFSVVVCAVGIFFSTAAGSKDECLNSYVCSCMNITNLIFGLVH